MLRRECLTGIVFKGKNGSKNNKSKQLLQVTRKEKVLMKSEKGYIPQSEAEADAKILNVGPAAKSEVSGNNQ